MKVTSYLAILRKGWRDPVWSKVIAAAIIAFASITISAFWVLIKSFTTDISFTETFISAVDLLDSSYVVKLWMLVILFFIVLSLSLKLFVELVRKVKSLRNLKDSSMLSAPVLNGESLNNETSDVFLYYRLLDAFPGKRGLQWLHDKEAVKRLTIILKEPFYFLPHENPNSYTPEHDPLWWFRGGSSMPVKQFKVLKGNKVLINNRELKIKAMAANVSDSRYLNFIYLDIEEDKQTGVYKWSREELKRKKESITTPTERVGLYQGKYYKGEEFDDGSTIIRGKHTDISDAELRIRCLSDWNIIICAKSSSFNSKKFDRISRPYFDEIISKKIFPEKLFEVMKEHAIND